MTNSVTRLSELTPDTPTRVDVEGVPVCLVRRGDTVKAIHDVCSHQYWSLSEGMVWDNGVECSLHGSTFDLDTGQPSSLPATRPVPTYATHIAGGEVFVDVTAATNGATPADHT